MSLRLRELLFSYFAAGFITSVLLNFFMWSLSAVLIGALTGYWISVGTFAAVTGILCLASLVSCSLMLLLTAIVKSSTAIGIISGLAGTFFGFLCGIYMPYTFLGSGTEKVGSVIPFTHLTIWMKRVVLTDACAQLGIAGEQKTLLMSDFFSADSVGFLGIAAPLWVMLIFCAVFSLACLVLARQILKKRIAG
jgi:multidrug/hemolysin transport system permease protein